jgi:hypothetical protein
MTRTTNQFFSLTRFGRLLQKQFIDNRGQWLTNIALLAGGLTTLAALVYSTVPPEVDKLRIPLFFVMGWGAWYVFVWQQTDHLNQKERAMSYLLQPASVVEKTLAIWLVTGVGFVVVYIGCFLLLDAVGVAFINNREWSMQQLDEIRTRGGLSYLKPFYESVELADLPPFLWVLTGLLHSFALAMLLTVRRYTLAIVAMLAFVLIGAGFFLNIWLANQLINPGNVVSGKPFEGVIIRLSNPNSYYDLDLPQPIADQLRWLVGVTVVLGLYAVAYFKLNEREV